MDTRKFSRTRMPFLGTEIIIIYLEFVDRIDNSFLRFTVLNHKAPPANQMTFYS